MANSIVTLIKNTEGLIEFAENTLSDMGCAVFDSLVEDPDGSDNWIVTIEFWGRESGKWIHAHSGTPEPNALDTSHPNRQKWVKLLALHKAIKAFRPHRPTDRELPILEELTRMGLIDLGLNFADQSRLQDIVDNL